MTDALPASHANWSAIDRTNDPDFFVRFLTASRSVPLQMAERDPAVFFSYLDVHEGHSVLDAACGLGEMTSVLSRLVGPTGRVLGVDISETMVREARRRVEGSNLPVEFHTGDIMALDFPDATFDRARAEQVLQHIPDPARGMAELARVTRPGGRVVVLEPDWDTCVIRADDPATSRKLTNFVTDRVIRHGRIGTALPDLFRGAGLTDISIFPQGIVAPYHGTREFIESAMAQAVTEGAIDEAAGRAWLTEIHSRGQEGSYLLAFILFRISGTVPS